MIVVVSYLLFDFAQGSEGRWIPVGQTLLPAIGAVQVWRYRKEILRGEYASADWGWALLAGPGLLVSWIFPSFFEGMTGFMVIFTGLFFCPVMAVWENVRFVLRRFLGAPIGDWWHG